MITEHVTPRQRNNDVHDQVRDRLERLRRRTWLTSAVRGAGLLVAVVLGAMFVVGLADWLFHVDDAGVRCLFAVAILVAAGWIAFHELARPLLKSRSDVALALDVEQRFPQLRDALASSAAFTAGGLDPSAGSPALQRSTIAEAERRLAGLRLESIVPTKEARSIASVAIGVCGLVVLVGLLKPLETGTALHRLLAPFGAPDWPRRTELAYVDEKLQPVEFDDDVPLRLAAGEPLELFAVNRLGPLPEETVLETRSDVKDEDVKSTPLRKLVLRNDEDGTERQAFSVAVPTDRGSIEFRVVGDDDRDQPFQRVEVLPPPGLESLQLTLTPPAYSGQERTSLPEGLGHVTALVGTRVEFEARTTTPVVRARLHVRDQEPVELAIPENGRSLRGEFVLREPGTGSYWLQLVDDEGLENIATTRYEIRAIEDRVPEVTIENPPTDQRVTARAVLPLEVVAKDDMWLVRIDRVEQVEREDGTRSPATRSLLWTASGRVEHERISVDDRLNIADYDLVPGDRLVLHAEAFDAYEPTATMPADPTMPRLGRSVSRTLVVVTDDDKLREIVADQAILEGELEDAAELQRRTAERVRDVQLQWDNVGELRADDVDQLESAELDQRRLSSQLADPVEGLLPRAERLLRTLNENGLGDATARAGLETIVDELALLREHDLPDAESGLTNGRKLAATAAEGTPKDAAGDVHDELSTAAAAQSRILGALTELTGRLSRSRGRRALELDLDEIVARQRELRDRTAGLVEGTFNRRFRDLSEQERAELEKIAASQRSRADDVERLQRQLRGTADSLDETNPDAADLVRDAANLLGEQATAARMTDVVERLRPNDPSETVRAGDALNEQERVLESLGDIRTTLEDRTVNDAETLVKELRRAEEELRALADEQAEILRKTREAENLGDAERERELETLEKRQNDLRRRASRLSRRARRLRANSASRATDRAGDRMEDVARLLKQRQPDRTHELQQETLDELEEALDDVASERRRAEERLAREMLETFAGELKSMIERQRGLLAESERLRTAVAERGGRPSRTMARTLVNLGDVQSGLANETDDLAEQLAAAEVFVVALRGAAERMRAAAKRLADKQADDPVVDAQRAALARLEALVAALSEENAGGDPAAQPPDGGGGAEQPTAGGDDELVSILAQLRLLKSLQEGLLARTERLDEMRGQGGLPDADLDAELESISSEQERIAALARELVRRLTGPSADSPIIDLDGEDQP